MTNKIIALALATTSIFTFSNCTKNAIFGSGPIVSESRVVGSFNSVTLDGSADVNISKGDSLQVTVKGFQNLVPLFTTTLQGNTLVLKFKDNAFINGNDNIIIDIVMPTFTNISLDGSGDINIASSFPNLEKVSFLVDGSGDITATNSIAKTINTKIDGSGNIHTFGVQADSITAVLDGSGNIDVSPNLFLNAQLDGSGNITYDTNPIVSKILKGSGNISKK
jgi:hypothetical protein